MRRDNFHRFIKTDSYRTLIAEAKLSEEISLFDMLRGGPSPRSIHEPSSREKPPASPQIGVHKLDQEFA